MQSPSKDGDVRADLLSAIDFELEVLRQERERSGISPWLLTTTLAVLAWLTLTEFGGSDAPGVLAVGAVLLVLTITDLFSWPIHTIAGLSPPSISGRIRYSRLTRGLSGVCWYVLLTRTAVVAGAAWLVDHGLHWLAVAPVAMISLFLILAMAFCLLVTRRIPGDRIVPVENTTSKAQHAAIVGTYGVICIAAGVLASYLVSAGLTFTEFKTGCLVGAAHVLGMLAVSSQRSNHTVKELQLIRRKLTLARIATADARHMVEQELLGIEPTPEPDRGH